MKGILRYSVLALVCIGCAHGGSSAVAEAVLRGTVAYRERMALPPDAVVEVWLTDVSPGNMVMALIAQTEVQSAGRQVPIPFELRYDPRRIDSGHTYGVRAVIRSGSRQLFTMDQPTHVITQGNPMQVNLMLTRVPDESNAGSSGLPETAWLLEDNGGAGVMDRIQATLEFAEVGRVTGNGSCNRFFGTVQISGDSITFGPLGSTRMACGEAVMNQEARYLKALQGAERFSRTGSMLFVFSKDVAQPLRFSQKDR